MEPASGMTTIKAEVPMAQLLTYAQSLTSMTGGRGEYSMHFLRYEEVPAHVAQKVIDETQKARDSSMPSRPCRRSRFRRVARPLAAGLASRPGGPSRALRGKVPASGL